MQAAIENTITDIMATRQTDNPGSNARPVHTTKIRLPSAKQPTFDWKVGDKYQEPCSFEIEIKNIFMTTLVIFHDFITIQRKVRRSQ